MSQRSSFLRARTKAWALGLLTVSLLCQTDRASAEVVFQEIAAGGTPIPDGGGANFVRFGIPTLENGTVIFTGNNNVQGGVGGLYTSTGGTLTRLADTSTGIPGGAGTFTDLVGTSTSGGTVVFSGTGSGSQSGVYTVPLSGGTVTRIADTSTPVAGGSGNFEFFLGSTIAGGVFSPATIAFQGRDTVNRDGIYTVSAAGGSITRIADESTVMPGTSNVFSRFDAPVVAADGTASFHGYDDPDLLETFRGVYSGTGGELTIIADGNTTIPGSSETFFTTNSPSISEDGAIAFRGEGSDPAGSLGVRNTGIYKSADGTLEVVADTSTPDPDGSGELIFFSGGNTPISGDNVAFLAFHETTPGVFQEGLYVSINGVVTPILFVGDMLFGKTVSLLFPGRESLEGNTLAFMAAFEPETPDGDPTFGVYTASFTPAAVPEPTSLTLLGLTLCGWGGVQWRRRAAA